MFLNRKQNILVTGARGQLGSYLVKELQKVSFKEKSPIGQVLGIDIDDLDLTQPHSVASFFNRSNSFDPTVKIDYVVHCAAATDTAAIEKDPLKYYASTVIGTKNVAESCAYNGIKMIHISTDYVMSELSPIGFYGKEIEFPVNQYGMHKLIAEKEAQLAYFNAKHPERLLIGRLSWLFGNSSNSFVEKLLKSICKTYANHIKSLKAGDKDCGCIEHRVVDDAFGKPTPVKLVLVKVLEAIDDKLSGIVDFQYNGSQISRLDWAMIVWSSFCSGVNSICSSEQSYEVLKAMASKVNLVGVKSSELELGMRHPGRVLYSGDVPYSEYSQCTVEYVDANISRLVELAMSTLREEGAI